MGTWLASCDRSQILTCSDSLSDLPIRSAEVVEKLEERAAGRADLDAEIPQAVVCV